MPLWPLQTLQRAALECTASLFHKIEEPCSKSGRVVARGCIARVILPLRCGHNK